MKVTIKRTTERTMSEIVDLVRSGKHVEEFQVGDLIDVGGITHAIIGIDVEEGLDHSMTVQRIDHVYDHVFSFKDNRYETSEIRRYLNEEYAEDLPAEFVEAIKPIKIDGMNGEERFFLLSSKDVDLEKSKYPFYHKRENRIKFDEDGFATWWGLRDPSAGYSYFVRYCFNDGGVYGTSAYYGERGLSPACVIA